MFEGFDIHDLIARYGYSFLGIVIGLESMGLPLPGETLLIATALYAAATGKIWIGWVVLSAALGAIIGDNMGYLVGRRVGAKMLMRHGPRIGITQERQRLGQYLFLKHGGKVVFFGRFIAFLRILAALLAGANRMPWGRFTFWNASGGIVWTCSFGFGAYWLGAQIDDLTGPFGITMGVVGAAVLIWAALFVRKHERRLIRDAEAALAAHEAAHGVVRGPAAAPH